MKKTSGLTVATLLILMLVQGCNLLNVDEDEDFVSGTGTITYLDFEGGFYGIIGDDGKNYDPGLLPSEFEKEDLKVTFKAIIRRDLMGTHMWGNIVEIRKIEKL